MKKCTCKKAPNLMGYITKHWPLLYNLPISDVNGSKKVLKGGFPFPCQMPHSIIFLFENLQVQATVINIPFQLVLSEFLAQSTCNLQHLHYVKGIIFLKQCTCLEMEAHLQLKILAKVTHSRRNIMGHRQCWRWSWCLLDYSKTGQLRIASCSFLHR